MYVPKAVSPQAVLVSTDPKQRNLQLFQSYDKKLRSLNPAEYRSVTDKFAKWANDPRAYYDEVKPIVCTSFQFSTRRDILTHIKDNPTIGGVRLLPVSTEQLT